MERWRCGDGDAEMERGGRGDEGAMGRDQELKL